MAHPQLASVLRHPLHGIVRIEVHHRRQQRFRWLFLFEAFMFLLCAVITIPIVIILIVVSGGEGGELPFPSLSAIGDRARVRWRETTVALVGPQGVVASAVARIEALEEGDQLLGQVLARANEGRVAVMETVGAGVVSAVWFGGQPLMLAPEHVDEARAWRVLQHEGVQVEDDGRGRCVIALKQPPPSRFASIVGLALLWPFFVWTSRGRETLAELGAGVRGHGICVSFEVDPHGVVYKRTRGGDTLDSARLDRADLLGIVHASLMSPGPDVQVRGPFLRLQTAERALVLDIIRNADVGRALRDALVGAAHRLWQGLSQSGVPAHCPYCATLYPYAVGACCPNCGAPPSALHGFGTPLQQGGS